MFLLNSIWLYALAALSLPVLIHLWNIRQGRTLKVGSISLMTASTQKSSRSIKVQDLLLLLVRCLLLALLALVLAGPYLRKKLDLSQTKGWVLLPKENLKETYAKFKPRIDSLTKAGYEFHYFNKDFPKTDLAVSLADKQVDTLKPASYWGLAQQLDEKVLAGIPVYLFTPNRLDCFKGERPELMTNLNWQTYVPADSTSTWIEKAWLTNENDIKVAQGNSKPGGTSYAYYNIHSGDRQNTSFVVSTENGRLTVGLRNGAQAVKVDTSAWQFSIFADKGSVDASYLKAALQSIVSFTGHKAVIKQYADPDQVPANQDWLFWLSALRPSNEYAKKCDHILSYDVGNAGTANTWLNNGGGDVTSQKVAVNRLFESDLSATDQPIWTDGFGNPVLTLERSSHTNIYHFNTHFDPAYSDLVWSDQFPKMLLKLIVGDEQKADWKRERRTIDVRQLVPGSGNQSHSSVGTSTITNLNQYAWLLLLLVFVIERWLAHRNTSATKKQIVQNG